MIKQTKIINRINESVKYFTVIFQTKTNYYKYFQAVILYKLFGKARFPYAKVKLFNSTFESRKNTLDIAHLSSLYEHETTQYLLSKTPKTFVDIGAHIGRFTVLLAHQGSKVIAFEPNQETFAQLLKHIQINNLKDNVVLFNLACYDSNGKMPLYLNKTNEGAYSLIDSRNESQLVEVKKLDDIQAKHSFLLNECIIKIDVEGAELKVLEGCKRILEHYSPILIIEIFQKELIKNISDYLSTYSYREKRVLDSRNYVFSK